MSTQTRFEVSLYDRLQASMGDLVERVGKAEGAERSRLLHWLLAAGSLFLLWRASRSTKKLFWILFGFGMAMHWSGGAWWLH
ncbi:MAG: hypothetical protein IT472_02430 [Thermomonas sp.]|uniref:hypothetical protein n=1 Tax=Thermomonas sp. TaxID=1971895 RepID=UPI002624757E|nr:hypothetical protein [Thermomonas sp.]MCC7096024.1 hypothetical protein [Thermomonas sp.]